MTGGVDPAATATEVDPLIVLAKKRFLLKHTDVEGVDRTALRSDILSYIESRSAAPMYDHFCQSLGWARDAALAERMASANRAKLEELEAKLKDAEENLGDVEVREALLAKADYLASIGDLDAALAAYDATEAKTIAMGQKLDLVFSSLRLGIFFEDWHLVKARLAKSQKIFEMGADWERKNRLKVYEAVMHMATRNFERAANLLGSSVATFTTVELMSYSDCIGYFVLMAMVALDRPRLKKEVIDSPEVLSVMPKLPHLRDYVTSFYDCNYRGFFQALSRVADTAAADPYLRAHVRHYLLEVRVAAFRQFLEPFKSVELRVMAESFGMSPSFLDAQLMELIVTGRLSCKMDRVAGVIQTNQLDSKNVVYQKTLKDGDALLTRLQKLSKVTDMD